MTKIIFSLFLILNSIQIFAFEVDPEALDGTKKPQISHRGDGPFDTYLTMDLPFGPFEALRKQLEDRVGPLKHRGEAHITVITPPEYFQVLKPAGITMEMIDELARKSKIQSSSFELICIGRGQAQALKTYYAVVRSEDLLKIRQKIAELYKESGGGHGEFRPGQYYPHITLGFTERDLHESDGVIKDEASCLENGKITLKEK